MEYKWTDIDYKLKELYPDYVPFELKSKEEQEESYDNSFDWDEE